MSNYRDTQTNDAERLAEAFKALSNPNRLKIFLQLMNCCEPGTVCSIKDVTTNLKTKCCVGDLGDGLDIAPSTLSHHIKELNRAGLIQMERRGQGVEGGSGAGGSAWGGGGEHGGNRVRGQDGEQRADADGHGSQGAAQTNEVAPPPDRLT